MRRILLSIAALATFMLVVPAPPALHATPIAVWTEPWQVTLGALTAAGDAVVSRGFGAVGFANEPLPGTSGVANSLANVFSTVGTDSIANTDVHFTRTFMLSGSPDGWFVTLDSALDGLMIAGGPADSPAAHLIADAVISGEGSTNEPYTDNVTATVNAPNNIVPINQAKTHAIILPDGTYTVIGELLTEATVDGYSTVGPITIGDPAGRASSNFADSFTVTTNATPFTGTIAMIPEPSYIVPSAGVLLLLLVTAIRKQHDHDDLSLTTIRR